jgi:hypothetical protein
MLITLLAWQRNRQWAGERLSLRSKTGRSALNKPGMKFVVALAYIDQLTWLANTSLS